jgi:hypothetical protein
LCGGHVWNVGNVGVDFRRGFAKRFELRKGDSGQSGGKPTCIGTVNVDINDQTTFDAAGKANGKTLVADVPHFSSIMPTVTPTVIHGIG